MKIEQKTEMSEKGKHLFGKGNNANPKGRGKGVQNAITKDLQLVLKKFADRNAENIDKWMLQIAETDPAKAMDIFLRVCAKYVPDLQRTQIEQTNPQQQAPNITIKLNQTNNHFASSEAEVNRNRLNAKGQEIIDISVMERVPDTLTFDLKPLKDRTKPNDTGIDQAPA